MNISGVGINGWTVNKEGLVAARMDQPSEVLACSLDPSQPGQDLRMDDGFVEALVALAPSLSLMRWGGGYHMAGN